MTTTLQARFSVVLGLIAACLLVVGAPSAARAGVLLHDDFNGTAGAFPTATVGTWDSSPVVATATYSEGKLDGSGDVVLRPSGNGGDDGLAASSDGASPTGLGLQLTVQVKNAASTQNLYFGLGDNSDHLMILRHYLGTTWRFDVYNGGGFGNSSFYDTGVLLTDPAGNTDAQWVIQWTSTHIVVLLNGSQVLDTATATPVITGAGGGDPSGPLWPVALNNGNDNINATLDAIDFQTIPEPASVSLLGAAGLILLSRRRR
jgi:hypothetical protein